ncbi:MAG: beta-propeller domain-containing protein [Candidatus Aenigmarchaeota archaeon]|nr:beta-propeller domain-containing protein [Candidatus Aenigmarchaeota archaeon]
MKKIVVLVLVAVIASVILLVPKGMESPKRFSSFQELQNFINDNMQNFGGQVSGMMAESKGVAADYSTTNIQVAGVDEADIVKNDGKYIYTVSSKKLIIADAYPAEEMNKVSEIDIENATIQEIFINGDKLILFGYESYYEPVYGIADDVMLKSAIYPYPYRNKAIILTYDITDRENPVMERNISLEGSYHTSRMVGDYVYAIITDYPIFYAENVRLPEIMSDGEVISVSATEIYYSDYSDYSYSYTNIVSFNVQDDSKAPEVESFLKGSTENVYVSKENIYLTRTKWIDWKTEQDMMIDRVLIPLLPLHLGIKINEIRSSNITYYEKSNIIQEVFYNYTNSLSDTEKAELQKSAIEKINVVQAELAKIKERTIIQKFSINNGEIDYKSTGEAPGSVLNQFSMDEYNGYFRIATTLSQNSFAVPGTAVQQTTSPIMETVNKSPVPIDTGIEIKRRPAIVQRTESQNNIYVLDESLNMVGSLENLAPTERIFSARFMGDRVYLVTFRRTDPLFVISLEDPTNPMVLGKLKIPGFSDYLHPYDENRIIGIGKDADEDGRALGLKLALFDVSDVANPKEIAKYVLEKGSDSEALNNHKAFLFSKDKNLLVIPISIYNYETRENFQGAYVFELTLNGFGLKGKIDHEGDWNSAIRRSLYMDNVLYTISNKMIMANSLADLQEINKLEL